MGHTLTEEWQISTISLSLLERYFLTKIGFFIMKNNMMKLAIIAITALTLSACCSMTKQERRVAKGAIAGAVLGSIVSGGDTGAVLGGAALGGVAGNQYDKRREQE